jgi:hypothetical protein
MTDPQVTLDIGQGVSAAQGVFTLLHSALTGARSVTIEVDNNTDLTLGRYGGLGYHKHGDYAAFPKDEIKPNDFIAFSSQNRSGWATGTEGYVYYTFGAFDSQAFLGILWNNPYVGDNSADAILQGAGNKKYKVRFAVSQLSMLAPFRFQLFKADDPRADGPQI